MTVNNMTCECNLFGAKQAHTEIHQCYSFLVRKAILSGIKYNLCHLKGDATRAADYFVREGMIYKHLERIGWTPYRGEIWPFCPE
jgi:hypothetical protein